MNVGIDATIPKYPARFRAKVIGSLLAVTVVSALAGSGMYVIRHRRLVASDFSDRGRFLASGLADRAVLGLLSGNTELLDAPLRDVLSQRDVAYAALYDETGTELIRRVRKGTCRPRELSQDVLDKVRSESVMEVAGGDCHDFLLAVVSSGRDGEMLAFGGTGPSKPKLLGWVRVGISSASLRRSVQGSLIDSVWLAGAVLAVGFVTALLVGWRLSAPIRRLNEGVDALRKGRLDHRVEVQSRDELGQLADSFNRMAWNLEDTLSRLERLNKGLEGEVAKRTDAIRRLSDFVKLLNGPRHLGPLVTEALAGVAELVRAPATALYLAQGEGLELARAHGVSGDLFGPTKVPVGERNVGRAAKGNEPLSIDEVPTSAGLSRALGTRPAGLVYWPVRFGDRLEGVLVVALGEPLDESSRDILGQAVGQLATALANARAYEALDRLAKELEERNRALVEQRDILQRQKEKLEEANRLKSQFLANTTHELRTPLNAIIGYTGLILEGAYGSVGSEQVEALQAIDESAQNLLALINQTLDYSKLEAGQMPLVTDSVDLVAICRDLVRASRGLTKERPYDVQYQGPEGPFLIETDGSKVKQVLLNLLSNAVKFTQEGSVVLTLRALGDGGAELSVQDTGIGIAEENQRLIFEAFRQVDGSTTRAAGGTGLGLAISLGFARLLGGRIDVESELGKGSRFVFRLPPRPPALGLDASQASVGDLEATMGVVADNEDSPLVHDLDALAFGLDGVVGSDRDLGATSVSGQNEQPSPDLGLVDMDEFDSGEDSFLSSAGSDLSDVSGLELIDLNSTGLGDTSAKKVGRAEQKHGPGMVEFDFGLVDPGKGGGKGGSETG